jgi:homocysteine S-methyltransferase
MPSDAVIVLDGGLASELEARGHDLHDRLWSARLLLTEPEAIEAVHLSYFRAGARVATTASYQATVEGFARAGLDRTAAMDAIGRSVALARAARDRFAEESGARPETMIIAGSVGPYGAMLADGSEYRGDYDPGATALRDLHRPRIDALLEAGVDILALETIPTVREAEVLVELVEAAGARAWLSFQCRDASTTAAGEPIERAIAVTRGQDGFVAVGVNCSAPNHVPGLLRRAGSVADRPLIAYPNAGDRWDAIDRHWRTKGGTGLQASRVVAWRELGATWLGGCCGVGPGAIRAIAEAVAA